MPKRAIYESMPRGDLIEALCQRDRAPASPVEPTRNAEHQAELEHLRGAVDAAEADLSMFADLFQQAPVAYCVLDRSCALVDANAAACTLLGKTRAALVGASLSGVVGVRERQLLDDHVARCLSERRRVSTELRLVCNGRERTYVLTSHPTGDGTFSKCASVLVDVTGMKEAEARARRLAQWTEQLVGISEPAHLAKAIADACASRIADACFVDLVGRDAEGDAMLRRAAVAPASESIALALQRQSGWTGWSHVAAGILRTLVPVYEPSSMATLGVRCEREIGAGSLVVLPMAGGGGALGLLGLVRVGAKRTYTLADLELVGSFARVAATALAVAAANAG